MFKQFRSHLLAIDRPRLDMESAKRIHDLVSLFPRYQIFKIHRTRENKMKTLVFEELIFFRESFVFYNDVNDKMKFQC